MAGGGGLRVLCPQGLLTAVILTRDHLFRPEELDRYKAAKEGLNSAQVAELLGTTPATVYAWTSKGELIGRKVGWSRLFDRAEIERFAAERGIVLRQPGLVEEDEGRRVG